MAKQIGRRKLVGLALGTTAAAALAACSAPAAPTAAPAKPTEAPKPAAAEPTKPAAAAPAATAPAAAAPAAAPTTAAAAAAPTTAAGAPTAAAKPADAAKPATSSVPASSGKKGGTFNYAEAGDFNNFNPWNFGAVNFEMYDQVFSRLLWKDGTGKANPDLATEWQLAPDNLSIKLKLRDGIKWHDGKAVTADDFVTMFGYNKDEALAKDPSVTKIRGLMGAIKEVTAPDKSTVQLNFSAPVPYITDILDYWFLIRIDDKSDPQFLKKPPIGTGPFKHVEWTPNQFARYAKNPDYWNKDFPLVDEFVFKRLSQAETLLPNLKSGSLDGILLSSLSDVQPLQADKNFNVDINDNAGSIFNMVVNINKPPFDKKEVRQALSYSLNRVEMAKSAFFGVSKPITSSFYSPASLGYREDLVMAHGFDLQKARKLLDDAGVKTLDLTLVVTPAWPQMKLFGLVWQQDLAKINVNLKLSDVENAKFYEIGGAKDLQGNDLIAWLNGRTTRDPAIFWSTQGNYRGGATNVYGYKNDELEKQVAAGAVETDPEKRKKIYQTLNELAINESHIIPVATNPRIWAYKNTVGGVKVDLNGNLFLDTTSVTK
jgi:peptide/nickel transport system substrate-binding protein